MTALPPGAHVPRIRRFFTQLVLVILINVPSISFGLAMGWVSLESGAGGEEEYEGGLALVGAAAATFLAGALAMPVAARAIAAGRKPAMLATSAAFVLCWSCKLCGGWGVVAGRAAAGLGGAAAWVIPPMLALEMCCGAVRGAAAVSLVLAHNVGFLLMYLAADYSVPHRTVLLCCAGLSLVHLVAYLFVPESPAYLAANGNHEKARASLAWCRGYSADCTSEELDAELSALPAPDLTPVSPFTLARDMLSDIRRRKAFMIALVTVVGQEMCGVLTLLQFAERVFSIARDQGEGRGVAREAQEEGGWRPASDAVVLGAVQLVASAAAIYLVEKIGRRPLLVWGATLTGVFLGAGAAAVWLGIRGGALVALAAAVAADSTGLQPAPYAVLPEMFTYQYRGCAVLLVTAAADLGNAVEIVIFPTIVHTAGLATALALASVLTLALAIFAIYMVPETMNKTPEEIYEILCPGLKDNPIDVSVQKSNEEEDRNNDFKELESTCYDIKNSFVNIGGTFESLEMVDDRREASLTPGYRSVPNSNIEVNDPSMPQGFNKDTNKIGDIIILNNNEIKLTSNRNDDDVILHSEHSTNSDKNTVFVHKEIKVNTNLDTKLKDKCSLDDTTEETSDAAVLPIPCKSTSSGHVSTASEVSDSGAVPIVIDKSEHCSKETEFTNM